MRILTTLTMLTILHPIVSHEKLPTPEIIKIDAGYPQDGLWVQIPKGTTEITFNVEAEHTETVLFWLIPTGTQTWAERTLLGYDIKENDRDQNFSLFWKIDRPYLHDHLHIQAIGEGLLMTSST